MTFGLSQRARDNSAASGGGDYLNPSKIRSGGSVRFHITSEEPTEFFECWGETADGSVKPFRFSAEPSPADIEAEMGPDYQRRMNREGSSPEPVKMVIAFWVFNYDTQKIELCSLSQKSLIRELDQITQMEDYHPLSDFDMIMGKEGSGLTTVYSLKAVPRKKDAVTAVDTAVTAADAAGYNINNLLTGDNPFKSL
jgi:hypothetical protein